MIGFTQQLSAGNPQGAHSFDVGPGVTRLAVALNASEELGADVDLYVRFGSAPTTSEWDCRAYGSNQWGFCSFDAPAEGTWHVLVNRYSGTSVYQVTATLFAGEGEPPPPPPAGDAQTLPQRRCLNRLASAGARVARAQAEDASDCVDAFARGRTSAPRPRRAAAHRAGVSLERRRRPRRRALARTLRARRRPLPGPPGAAPRLRLPRRRTGERGRPRSGRRRWSRTSSATISTRCSPSPRARPLSARCQEAVAARDRRRARGGHRASRRRGQHAALRGRGPAGPVESAAELETALLAAFAADRQAASAARGRTSSGDVTGSCRATEQPLAALLPGVCSAAADEPALADCADRAALCRLCRATNAMGGLALDCDLFDDGVPDLTCPSLGLLAAARCAPRCARLAAPPRAEC